MIIAIATFLCFTEPLPAAEWTWYGRSENRSYEAFYDKKGIVTTPEKFLMVPVKYVYTEAGKKKVIQSRTEFGLPIDGYDKLIYSSLLLRFNCKKREYAILTVDEIGANDKVLDQYNPSTTQWSPVVPESLGEALFTRVCSKID